MNNFFKRTQPVTGRHSQGRAIEVFRSFHFDHSGHEIISFASPAIAKYDYDLSKGEVKRKPSTQSVEELFRLKLTTFVLMRFTFKKEEKLKSKKLIEQLFKKGESISKYPLRMNYLKLEHSSNYPIQATFSAPKKKFKKAVDRNRIKRLMREAYRKNKHLLYDAITEKYIIMFTFIDENEHKYVEIEEKMIVLLKKLIDKTKS